MSCILSATSSEKEEILHTEIKKKFSFFCCSSQTSGHKCKKNYERTRDVREVVSALNIFTCSL